MMTKLSIQPKSVAGNIEEKGNSVSVGGCIGVVNFKVLYSSLTLGKSLTIKVINAKSTADNTGNEVASYKVTKSSEGELSGVCELDIKPSAKAGEFYAIYCQHDNATNVTIAGEICFDTRYRE